jgi:hypothetical protein
MVDAPRRFPPPWHADKIPGGYVVRDANGQALTYVYSRNSAVEAMQAKVLTPSHDLEPIEPERRASRERKTFGTPVKMRPGRRAAHAFSRRARYPLSGQGIGLVWRGR